MTWRVIHADCIEAMRELGEASVDAIVTDPPYGLEFMGKEWDRLDGENAPGYTERPRFTDDHMGKGFHALPNFYTTGPKAQRWHQTWAAEALRVLKPGGHLLAFGGTRTYHRLACALEDAGFEIRDCLAWLYSSGFPKSLDVSKAIDKAAGAAREVVGSRRQRGSPNGVAPFNTASAPEEMLTAPATPDAERWQGWGTALKPAFEPIVLARKPLSGTVAQNVLEHGTGALNIDGTRIGTDGGTQSESRGEQQGVTYANGALAGDYGERVPGLGRWPANVLLDPEAAEILDEQSGERPTGAVKPYEYGGAPERIYGASRFFYTAKTSRAERERGVREYTDLESASVHPPSGDDRVWDIPGSRSQHRRNNHPTVKPVDLMQWLCRLITLPKGLVLDPFLGSGSTGIAALREGFDFIGIEREAEYVEIARARIIGDAPLFNAEEVIAGNTPS